MHDFRNAKPKDLIRFRTAEKEKFDFGRKGDRPPSDLMTRDLVTWRVFGQNQTQGNGVIDTTKPVMWRYWYIRKKQHTFIQKEVEAYVVYTSVYVVQVVDHTKVFSR